MKVYISADIEGVSGIVNWDEATRWKPDYNAFSFQMMKEVIAACEGSCNAAASEIWIKDAHGVGRNLSFDGLPESARLIRSFSGHPFGMMQEIDNSFDAVIMIGYHTFAGSDGSPLAHTLETDLAYLRVNGMLASEFLINSYTASYVGVPVVFVSGDFELGEHVKGINPEIRFVGLNKGIGNSIIAIHPNSAIELIRTGVEASLKGDLEKCTIPLPNSFNVELSFINHTKAYRASFYPGMKKVSSTNLMFYTEDYFEVLRMLNFVL